MALYDGPDGTWVKRGNGPWEPVYPSQASATFNGQSIYEYDDRNGVLKIAATEDEFNEMISKAPDFPIPQLELSGPTGKFVFQNVRGIERMPALEQANRSGIRAFLRKRFGI